MDGDLYYPMSRKRLGHAVIINNLDREQIPTQRWGFLKRVDFANFVRRDVSSMATVLQEIGECLVLKAFWTSLVQLFFSLSKKTCHRF